MEQARRIKSYKDLRVWQEAMDLVAEAKEFPPEERFGLTADAKETAVLPLPTPDPRSLMPNL